MKAIHVLRKPCSESTVAANVLKHGTGALNIDATRIGTAADVPSVHAVRQADEMTKYGKDLRREGDVVAWEPKGGRWPANVILTHAPGCVQAGVRKVKSFKLKFASEGQGIGSKNGIYSPKGARPAGVELGYADADGTETVAAYDCAPGCPVAALDAQSGVLHARGNQTPTKRGSGGIFWVGNGNGVDPPRPELNDTGGASRFFKQFGGTLR